MSTPTPEIERDETTRVHAWFVGSDGVEVHVTRRGTDGKWYLNSTDREVEPQFVSLEQAADIFAMAIAEERPYESIPGIPNAEKWDAAVREALGLDSEEEGEEN